MIIDFGSLQLMSVDQGNHQPLSPSFSSLEEIMDRAYERYSLELRSVQVLYSKSESQRLGLFCLEDGCVECVPEHMDRSFCSVAKFASKRREELRGPRQGAAVQETQARVPPRSQGRVLQSRRHKPGTSSGPVVVPSNEDLGPAQKQALRELIDRKHCLVFRKKRLQKRPYRIPEARRKAVKQEVEDGSPTWYSPIVLPLRPDGSLPFLQ
ncbi:hypothetical protein J4Q44_G00348510 [Coregonus suidteri]|uniref:Uncharacterized protein n=1 Tax=Coregonus suidteri TaxID=861788 RepID=A0AAN8QBV5_9TELE